MELEFLAIMRIGTSTEQEGLVWYIYTAGEVEWMESTAVTYLIQQVLFRNYTLECTM